MVRKSPRRKKQPKRMTFDSDGKYVSKAVASPRKKATTPVLGRMWTHNLGGGRTENRIHRRRSKSPSSRRDPKKKSSSPSVPGILQRMWTHTLASGRSEDRLHRVAQDDEQDTKTQRRRSKSPSSRRAPKNSSPGNLQRMWTHTLSSGRSEDRLHRVEQDDEDTKIYNDDDDEEDTKIYNDDEDDDVNNDTSSSTSISSLIPSADDIQVVVSKVVEKARKISSDTRREVETYVNSAAPWVTKQKLWNRVLQWAAALVLVCFVAETISPTAYGRFGDSSSIALDSRIGWWLMELPCSVVFVYQFFIVGGPRSHMYVPRCMAAIFCCHYLYRGWVFPYMINTYAGVKNFSIVPAVFSWIVTCTHAYLNAKWFSTWGTHLDRRWVRTRCFKVAAATYYVGLILIIWHDKILRDLRPCPGGKRYCIPEGGLFDYATCAQYTAELIAWFGFWAMSCGPNGAFIFLVSVANLVPRSVVTHNWYLSKFDSYRSLGRSRLVPGLW